MTVAWKGKMKIWDLVKKKQQCKTWTSQWGGCDALRQGSTHPHYSIWISFFLIFCLFLFQALGVSSLYSFKIYSVYCYNTPWKHGSWYAYQVADHTHTCIY